MKKFIVVFVGMSLILPSLAFGQSIGDIQAEIDALSRRLTELRETLTRGSRDIAPPPATEGVSDLTLTLPNATPAIGCIDLKTNFGWGASDGSTGGQQVTKLQKFLVSQGYDLEIAGVFGGNTHRAVRTFQSRNTIEVTGFVGPLTRARIKELTCGSGASSRPTVSVVGIPSLKIEYDSNAKESALVARFQVAVRGEALIPEWGFDTVAASNQSLLTPPKNAMIIDIDNAGNNEKISLLNSNGQFSTTVYKVPSNGQATFTIEARFDPRIMFGGQYRASLRSVGSYASESLPLDDPANPNTFTYLPLPSNQTNPVTIIGEVSPYLNLISPKIGSSGDTFTITGVRLPVNGGVVIVGTKTDGSDVPIITSTPTATTFRAQNLRAGVYSVFVRDPITGDSNNLTFEIAGGTNSLDRVTVTEPKLALTLSGANEESLTATFKVRVFAGSSALTIPTERGINNIPLKDSTGKYHSFNSYPQVKYLSTEATLGNSTEYGPVYVIPAGTSATFTVTATYNPKQMFAGTYTASVSSVFIANRQTSLTADFNETNKVTVVGEVSPYITSVTSPVDVNGTVTIRGVRFHPTNNTVRVGTIEFSRPSSDNGTAITFKPNDYALKAQSGYAVSVTNPQTGGSNSGSLEITSNVIQPLLRIISPVGGEVWKSAGAVTDTISGFESYRRDISWTGGSTQDPYTDVIKAYLESFVDGEYRVVGRIPPFGFGSIQWVVGVVSKTDCVLNYENDYSRYCLNRANLKVVDPGRYYIHLVDKRTETSTRSGLITITAPTAFRVWSPNGGETFQAGASIPVAFNPDGVYGKPVTIELVNLDTGAEYPLVQNIIGEATDKQSVMVTIPANTVVGSRYKIRLCGTNWIGACTPQDLSDNVFKITGPPTTPLPPPPPTATTTASQLHAVGVYRGTLPAGASTANHPTGTVNITIAGGSIPIALALTAYEPVNWVISNPTNRQISQVLLAGYYAQTVQGISSSVTVTKKIYKEGANDYFYFYTTPLTTTISSKLKSATGLDVTKAQSASTGSSFTVGGDTAREETITQVGNALQAIQNLLNALR